MCYLVFINLFQGGKEHICQLAASNQIEMGLRLMALVLDQILLKIPIYVDIQNDEELAIEGYETMVGIKLKG